MIDTRHQIHEALLNLLWDQWAALGVAGHERGGGIPFVIDLEALVLATLRFAMKPGRFRGEVLDWLAQNGELISVQRIKNLQTAIKLAPEPLLISLSEFMQEAGYRNWKGLAKRQATNESKIASFDDEPRGLSQSPVFERQENLILRMRLIFGISARPEIITWLHTHRAGHAAGIARDTAWFSKSVQAILNDLVNAGVLVARMVGKRKEFSMNSRNTIWNPKFRNRLYWLTQGPFYLGLHHVLETLSDLESSHFSPRAEAIAIRKRLPSMSAAFRLAGQDNLYVAGLFERGEALNECFSEDTERLVTILKEPKLLRRPGMSV